jgi:hypothetical protein
MIFWAFRLAAGILVLRQYDLVFQRASQLTKIGRANGVVVLCIAIVVAIVLWMTSDMKHQMSSPYFASLIRSHAGEYFAAMAYIYSTSMALGSACLLQHIWKVTRGARHSWSDGLHRDN